MVGLLATLALMLLGFSWPSVHIPIALFAIAAPFIFAVSLIRPRLLRGRPLLSGYAALCTILSVASWGFQFLWLVWLMPRAV
ncbi:MAG: hypothetical protein AAFN13_10880 [Bacteroidota bacterium]